MFSQWTQCVSLALDGSLVAAVALRDEPKQEAKRVLQLLEERGYEVRPLYFVWIESDTRYTRFGC